MSFHPSYYPIALPLDVSYQQLQNAYKTLCQTHEQEVTAHQDLQRRYDELQMMVRHQQKMVAMVKELYGEQVLAATTDPITNLPNHRAVITRVEDEVSRCQNEATSCAILFVDLDHFKRVNDTWGHRAGDAILHEVASRLRSALRQGDFVGRYGGEEFAIVLTNVDVSEAVLIAERVRACVALQPCTWEIEDTQTLVEIPITTSIGVAVYQLHGVTRTMLIECADRAMYRAKRSGRNRVCLAGLESSSAAEQDTSLSYLQEQAAIHALCAVASAHDTSTSGHAQRMMSLTAATARKLACSEEEVRLVRLAALFHDIGKVGISDTILHKPGSLTPEEWEMMRQHPQIGGQILENVGGIFGLMAKIVVSHHERWDGQGYPHGLAGEAIPISARIISVVDSYDAMTSERPYRQPLSLNEARKELQNGMGSQYDPCVVEAFLSLLDEQGNEQMGQFSSPYAQAV